MTPDEAINELYNCCNVQYEAIEVLKETIKVFKIYLKNTTIDCIQPFISQAYVVSIRSKITKQVDYEEVIKFLKKYYKEEYEKCLNIFTSK